MLPRAVTLLYSPHIEPFALAFQKQVLEPLARRKRIKLQRSTPVFPRDKLFFDRAENTRVYILLVSPGIEAGTLRGVPLLESLRYRHGRSVTVLPVLVEPVDAELATGFSPVVARIPATNPYLTDVFFGVSQRLEKAIEELEPLRVNHSELPAPRTLVGREKELEEIDELLHSGARFVCLTAPFGRGATNLARAYAESVRADYPGGVIEVAATSDDEAMQRLAQPLGMHTIDPSVQSPAVPVQMALEHLDESLILFDTGMRPFHGFPLQPAGARMIVTTHLELTVPTYYTYQVPRLSDSGRQALAAHLGLAGPIVDLAAGEPLAYVLLRAIRAMDEDDERIVRALQSEVTALKREELHQSWLTPIAAFFSVWWSLLTEPTRTIVLAASLCPASATLPRERVERFADIGDDFASEIPKLENAALVTSNGAELLSFQPALIAWIEKYQTEARRRVLRRAEEVERRYGRALSFSTCG